MPKRRDSPWLEGHEEEAQEEHKLITEISSELLSLIWASKQCLTEEQEQILCMSLHEEAGLYVNESNSMEAWTPMAALLDITKAYPRVNDPILWSMLQKYEIKEESSRILKGLH